MAETTEVSKMSPMSFFIALIFILILAAIAAAHLNVQWKKEDQAQ